jgi:DNA-binding response OmpR family regulator
MPKLLLVEDEKSIAEGLAITLEAEGFQVAWVKDGSTRSRPGSGSAPTSSCST